MKIFFIGSKHEIPSDKVDAFDGISNCLGYEIASRRWNALLSSDTVNTIDHHIVKGIQRHFNECRPEKSRIIELHRLKPKRSNGPSDTVVARLLRDGLLIKQILYDVTTITSELGDDDFEDERHETRHEAREKYVWAQAHAGLIHRCDIVLSLGGRLHTKRALSLAKAMRVPILSLPHAAGESSQWFQDSAESYYDIFSEYPGLCFLDCDSHGDTAKKAMDIAMVLATHGKKKEHTYFLSYSREDSEVCDHIEVMLLRHGRRVFRDIYHIEGGGIVKDHIKDLIRQSDTFIRLESRNYMGSNYCRSEKRIASKITGLRKIGIWIASSSHPPYSSTNFLLGTDRDKRKIAVDKLVGEEASRTP